MSNYSLKMRILLVLVVSIGVMAFIFLTMVIRGMYGLGNDQMKDQTALIRSLNQQEVQNYLQIAQEAVKAYYDKTRDDRIVEKVKEEASRFEDILEAIYNDKKGTMSEKELRELLVHIIQGYRYNKGAGYFYAYELDGMNVSHENKSLIGKNLIDRQDPKGNYTVRMIIEAAKAPSGTNVTRFFIKNPITNEIEPKVLLPQ